MTYPTYLVQRIKVNQHPREDSKGIDKSFSFDYMGSSEFEWGALPKALKNMRDWVAKPKSGGDAIVLEVMNFKGLKGYYVGRKNDYESAYALFMDQLSENKIRLKERSRMKGSYSEEGFDKDIIGWWAIDQVVPWAIFKYEAHAQLFKVGVYGESIKAPEKKSKKHKATKYSAF